MRVVAVLLFGLLALAGCVSDEPTAPVGAPATAAPAAPNMHWETTFETHLLAKLPARVDGVPSYYLDDPASTMPAYSITVQQVQRGQPVGAAAVLAGPGVGHLSGTCASLRVGFPVGEAATEWVVSARYADGSTLPISPMDAWGRPGPSIPHLISQPAETLPDFGYHVDQRSFDLLLTDGQRNVTPLPDHPVFVLAAPSGTNSPLTKLVGGRLQQATLLGWEAHGSGACQRLAGTNPPNAVKASDPFEAWDGPGGGPQPQTSLAQVGHLTLLLDLDAAHFGASDGIHDGFVADGIAKRAWDLDAGHGLVPTSARVRGAVVRTADGRAGVGGFLDDIPLLPATVSQRGNLSITLDAQTHATDAGAGNLWVMGPASAHGGAQWPREDGFAYAAFGSHLDIAVRSFTAFPAGATDLRVTSCAGQATFRAQAGDLFQVDLGPESRWCGFDVEVSAAEADVDVSWTQTATPRALLPQDLAPYFTQGGVAPLVPSA